MEFEGEKEVNILLKIERRKNMETILKEILREQKKTNKMLQTIVSSLEQEVNISSEKVIESIQDYSTSLDSSGRFK